MSSLPDDDVEVAPGVFQSQADIDTNNALDDIEAEDEAHRDQMEEERHQVINEEFNTDASRGII